MPSPPRAAICAVCESPFAARSRTTRTCGRKCGATLREREHPSPGKAPRNYPPGIVQIVRDLYGSGLTVAEVQARIPSGFKAQNIIWRYGIPTRPAGPRDQTGASNPLWRGNDAGYSAMHFRVDAARGKPSRCACCDTADQDGRYEWANLSGHYEDVTDYARLCVPCHRRLDARRRAQLGGRTSPMKGGGASV